MTVETVGMSGRVSCCFGIDFSWMGDNSCILDPPCGIHTGRRCRCHCTGSKWHSASAGFPAYAGAALEPKNPPKNYSYKNHYQREMCISNHGRCLPLDNYSMPMTAYTVNHTAHIAYTMHDASAVRRSRNATFKRIPIHVTGENLWVCKIPPPPPPQRTSQRRTTARKSSDSGLTTCHLLLQW